MPDELALEVDPPEEVVDVVDELLAELFEPPPKPIAATAAMTKMTTTAAIIIRIGLLFEGAGSGFIAFLDR